MTVTTQAPSAPSRAAAAGAGGGGRWARRAMLRWAVRLFRREWRQQLLVLALLTVAVAATIGGIALAVNASPSQAAELGSANHILTLDGSTPRLAEDIAAARSAFGAAEPIAHQRLAVPGSVIALDVRDQDPAGVFGHSMLRLDAGRYPTGANEIALTDGAASLVGVQVGGSLDAGGRTGIVVGIVENPQKLSDEFVLVAVGQLDRPEGVSLLVDATRAQVDALRMPDGAGLTIRAYSTVADSQAAAIVLAIATIGMLFVGLVAVAGFAVMAQRRLRSLGMLGAVGATDRHVRFVMLANGALVGIVGAVAGSIVGLGAWLSMAGRLEHPTNHRIARLDLPWWSLLATITLSIVTAVGSAWWPARTAARIPVVSALSGRPPRPQPPHRFAALGAALVAGGYVLLLLAHRRRPLLIIGGTLTTMLGVLFLAPLAIRALSFVAARAPISIRLALRDLVRYQSRSGAALGAAALALGIAATISISATAAQATAESTGGRGNLPTNEVVVYVSGHDFGGPVPVVSDAALQAARSAVPRIGTAIGASSSTALERAINPNTPALAAEGGGAGGRDPASLVKVTRGPNGMGAELIANMYVATTDVLRYDGVDPSMIDPTADVLTPRRDLGATEILAGMKATLTPKFQHLDLPVYTAEPTTLITFGAVEKLGLKPITAAWVLRSPTALTSAQIAAGTRVAAAAGLSIETRHSGSSYRQLRTDSTAIGALLALGVLAMTVGLIRSETAGDMRTLSATGASSRTRRTVVGATAGALGLLGALLGTLGAYLALLAWHGGALSSLAHVPVVELLVLTIGLPLVAATGGWLLAGPEPRAIARAPIT